MLHDKLEAMVMKVTNSVIDMHKLSLSCRGFDIDKILCIHAIILIFL